MKHRVALVAVSAAVLITAACGGGGGSSSPGTGRSATTGTTTAAAAAAAAATADAVEWTGTFCGGIGPTVESVLALLKSMFEGGASDPAVQKAALLDYSDKAGTAMAGAGKKLDGLGAPSENARELHDELVGFFTDSGSTLAELNTRLAALDPADPGFAAELERLGGDQADPSKLQEQVKKLQSDPELGEAFKQAPECVRLTETLKSLGG